MVQHPHVPPPSGVAPATSPTVFEIERAFDARDFARTARLIEHDLLAFWCTLPPSRTAEIISAVLRTSEATTPFIQFAATMLFADGGGADLPPRTVVNPPLRSRRADRSQQMAALGRVLALRLRGRPVEALASAEFAERRRAEAPFLDSSGGWRLFTAVQRGITAMLAGDFSRALADFAQARLQPVHAPLASLVRDACVRSAVIEVLYGDARRAVTLLREAEHTPRTESWIEEQVDAARVIVLSRLPDRDPEEALELLDAVRLSSLGEVWPFYVVAVLRASVDVGDLHEARRRLKTLEQLSFSRVDGQGFTGSVFPLGRALISIAAGDLSTARDHLDRADPDSPDSGIVRAFLELSANRYREALLCTAKLRNSTFVLRLLEVTRLAVSAGAYLALDDRPAWESVVRTAAAMPGGIRPGEAALFPPRVRAFAEEHLQRWPRGNAPTDIGLDLFSAERARFTRREVEIIRALGTEMSRAEIARSQFVSENTVKTQLRTIYRKLGVTSRNAAVLEAESRGLLYT